MFGIDDPGIYLAYLFAILCLIGGVVFGMINWNKGEINNDNELNEEISWEKEEDKINEDF